MTSLGIDWGVLGNAAWKISLAYGLTLPMGWWREREIHAVGIRTFPIVAMASCGYLLIFQGGPDTQTMDSRVLQGLIAGIGFVGGGAIVRDGMSVHGTATAASLWNTGAIGAAVALGRVEVAIVLSVMNLVALQGMVRLKKKLDGNPLDWEKNK